MKLLELLLLLKKAEKTPDVQRYLEAEENAPFGWIPKNELEARRNKAEESLGKLQAQFEKLLEPRSE